jgi:hypothetical protein
MSAAPRVTAIVVCFNYARFLTRALESVLAQPYPNLEVILVDDGSTDETPEVAARFADRIRSIRKENGGPSSACNVGFAAATGDYLFLLAADDELVDDRITEPVEILERRPEVGIVYGDLELIGAEGEPLHPSYMRMCGVEPPSGDALDHELRFNHVPGGTMLLRRSLLDLYYPIPEHLLAEDWWIGFQVARTHEIAYLPKPLIRYRRHGANQNLDNWEDPRIKLDEVKLRRLMLTSGVLAERDRVSLESIEHCVREAALRVPAVREQLALGDADAFAADDARRQGEEAERARDLDGAARAYAEAYGHDPRRGDLAQLALEAAEGARLRAEGLPGTELRSRRLLVFADHLLANPSLVDAIDDAGVSVIVQVASAEQLAGLAELVEGVGADFVAVSEPVERLAAVADALLAATPYGGALGRLPRVATSGDLKGPAPASITRV